MVEYEEESHHYWELLTHDDTMDRDVQSHDMLMLTPHPTLALAVLAGALPQSG